MAIKLGEHFKRGAGLVRDNPQIVYTIFLLIVIPFAFLYTGQKFLDVSIENQERIERERLGLFQDTLSLLAKKDTNFLQENILTLGAQNPAVKELRVLALNNSEFTVMASLNNEDLGITDIDEEKMRLYRYVSLEPETSFISQKFIGEERHWEAVRAITDDLGQVSGVIYTDISLENIDSIANKNIKQAYIILSFIILGIVILLFRQARIIDYAVLFRQLKEVDKFYGGLLEMPESNRQYSKFSEKYVELESELRSLYIRNKSKPLNEESGEISKIILDFWLKYKAKHKEKDKYSNGNAKLDKSKFIRLFTSAANAESAKKLASEDKDVNK